MNSTPIYKSKPPLRWFVDLVLHRISMYYFIKGLRISDRYEDEDEMPFRQYKKMTRAHKKYIFFAKPYQRWGTYYKVDFDFTEDVDREDV